MQVLTGLHFVSFAVKRRTFPPMFSPNKWGIKLIDTTRQQNQKRYFLRLFFAQNFLFWQTREANWKCSKSIVFERIFIIVQRKVNSFCKEKELLLPVFTLSDRRRLFRDAIRTSRRAPQGRLYDFSTPLTPLSERSRVNTTNGTSQPRGCRALKGFATQGANFYPWNPTP